MRFLRMPPVAKLCSTLCVALALVFAGTALASVVDRIQHAPGGSSAHEHLLFSEIATEDASDRASHEPDQGKESPSDLAGGHHHHGDSGLGLAVTPAGDLRLAALAGDNPGFLPDRRPVGIRLPGPERPPRSSTISA